MEGNRLIVPLCEKKTYKKTWGGLGQELVERWSVDPTVADIDMSLESINQSIRQKAKEVAKKKAKEKATSWAKKALDWKSWKTP